MANVIKGGAKEVYQAFSAYLKGIDLKFDVEEGENNYTITAAGTGEDIPMYFSIDIDGKRELIILMSHMPFKIDPDKRIEGAVATSILNHFLADGSFDYDINTGSILFRLTSSFRGGIISDKVFEYMFFLAGGIVDKYNDKLLMISTGAWDLEEFAKFVEDN